MRTRRCHPARSGKWAASLGAVLLVASCGGEQAATPVDMPEWTTLIDQTRDLQPSQVTVELLVEHDDEPIGGAGLTSVGDWNERLLDLSLFEPLTNTPLSRIVVNGDTSWVLSAADQFNDGLPEGIEIVRAPTETLVDGGIIPTTAAQLTAPLDLLRGAERAVRRSDGTFEVTLDPLTAVTAVEADAADSMGLSLEGVTGAIAVAEVVLADDGISIETFRIRIEGSLEGREWLTTGTVTVASLTTELNFDPPDPALVVDLADVPEVAPLLTR